MTSMTSSLILDPPMAAATLVAVGYKKSHLPTWKMFILGMLAGIYVAFGNQALYAILAPGGADNSWTAGNSTTYEPASGLLKFFGGVVFSTVLVVIVICGAELFTGNCLILMAVLNGTVTWKEMFFDWFVVYFANFFGNIAFTVIIYAGGVNGYYYSVDANDVSNRDKGLTRTGMECCALAAKKADMRPHEMFFSAIPANLMVCIAVIMAMAAKSAVGKVAVCAFPIGIFVCCGWNHSIANQSLFTMATLLNCHNGEKHGLYWLNLLLVTIGNIGGASILAISYWATYIVDSPNEDLHHPHLVPSNEPIVEKKEDSSAVVAVNGNKDITISPQEMKDVSPASTTFLLDKKSSKDDAHNKNQNSHDE